ncbi:hypothetical protein BaRGS_00038218 [Batillaria attramentaria]|uniref:Uncharacterized protein n=1 Tax=Batillaria attramentaria TaxID=370345 RepID=A0ABD0J7G7_9CAEN
MPKWPDGNPRKKKKAGHISGGLPNNCRGPRPLMYDTIIRLSVMVCSFSRTLCIRMTPSGRLGGHRLTPLQRNPARSPDIACDQVNMELVPLRLV